MSELTPEEKRRIYEEEKERMKAQEKIKKKTKPATWGCLTLIIIIAIVWLAGVFSPSKKSEAPLPPVQKKEEVELKASVIFTGTQFVITNKNNFNWTNIRLEVNRGYYYEAEKIRPSIEYTIGAMQFAKRDGTRFNPLTMKPKNFFIAADTPKGRAYYTGGWK